MFSVQSLNQNLSSRLIVSSLLTSKGKKRIILNAKRGLVATKIFSKTDRWLVLVQVQKLFVRKYYVCDTWVPIALRQNNIYFIIFRTIGRQMRSCVRANQELWGKYSLQHNFISCSCSPFAVPLFCLYHIIVIWYQANKLRQLLTKSTLHTKSTHDHN